MDDRFDAVKLFNEMIEEILREEEDEYGPGQFLELIPEVDDPITEPEEVIPIKLKIIEEVEGELSKNHVIGW